MKRIPIKDAAAFAAAQGLDRIIVLGSDAGDGSTSIVTWGATKEKCKEAAKAQSFWNGTFRQNVLVHAGPDTINLATDSVDRSLTVEELGLLSWIFKEYGVHKQYPAFVD